MDVIRTLGLTVLLVVLADWLFFTKVGGDFSDFDYRYWPLSRARLISLVVMMSTVACLAIFAPPNAVNPPMWALIPLGIVLIGHIAVGYRDIAIQRRTGYRTPPRYSGED